jgi:pSer/pThr/pTyr-binding forkhead associated (FHA) protein
LILLQKKPTLKLLTSLVDLDQVLDKIEDEGKSCVVSASQDEFLAVLRYEKGQTKALCHELSTLVPTEQSFREDFLIKIYTLSAEKPLTINVYEDLLVRYATDAKMIDDKYKGSITDLFVSKPPIVTLELKGKEIGHWVLDKPVLTIGRTEDNDIVIDNLAVSRTHSVIEEDKGKYYVRDCDSMNGTMINGNRIGRGLLNDGDEIQIGKHTLTFQRQSGRRIPLSPAPVGFDQTVIIHPDKMTPPPIPENEVSTQRPRLIEKTKTGGKVFEIRNSNLILGKDERADVEIGGVFVAKEHAEITRKNGGFVIRHLAGRRRVKVGGVPVKEHVLRDNDLITIGGKEFIFHE